VRVCVYVCMCVCAYQSAWKDLLQEDAHLYFVKHIATLSISTDKRLLSLYIISVMARRYVCMCMYVCVCVYVCVCLCVCMCTIMPMM